MLSNTLDFHHDYSSKNFMLLGNTRMLVNPDKDTKGGTGKKNQRERDDNGKTGQNIFACCVVPKYLVRPHTARMWL